ncbi:MAG TPA: hypothetical protein VHV47_12055 [Opitutaceae bacterium]|jgi:hypothetical protein|nr:hypothetical protein [Opitutaceae bacterium]
MRVILDECLPRRLVRELSDHSVSTVAQQGWAGIINGELLKRIDGRFEVFLIIDGNLPAQNKIAGLSFGVVVLRATSNRFADLKPLVPAVLGAITGIKAGQLVFVP